jgi:hypothetical protein
VDPLNAKNLKQMEEEDKDEIQVPKNIQEIIERNIRTLSNSLSTTNKSAMEPETQVVKISTLNKALAATNPIDLKELQESWFTKNELEQNTRTASLNTKEERIRKYRKK